MVEVLSPSDKRPSKTRDKYLDKRAKLLGSRTHLVEIDLLRGGLRMPTTGLPDCDYYCAVSRHPGRPRAEFWPFHLGQPLPALPLPLLPGDAEPVIALKPVLDRVYDEGHYADRLYTDQPDPPLTPDQAAWAAGFLPPDRPMTAFPEAARSADEAAFLRAILADLPNDLPRLVYADWLDDREDARAAVLRQTLHFARDRRQAAEGRQTGPVAGTDRSAVAGRTSRGEPVGAGRDSVATGPPGRLTGAQEGERLPVGASFKTPSEAAR